MQTRLALTRQLTLLRLPNLTKMTCRTSVKCSRNDRLLHIKHPVRIKIVSSASVQMALDIEIEAQAPCRTLTQVQIQRLLLPPNVPGDRRLCQTHPLRRSCETDLPGGIDAAQVIDFVYKPSWPMRASVRSPNALLKPQTRSKRGITD